jgi:hypothetical protein
LKQEKSHNLRNLKGSHSILFLSLLTSPSNWCWHQHAEVLPIKATCVQEFGPKSYCVLNADGLNAPISLQEVLHGLKHLHNGRATGKTGIPSEFIRYAEPERRPGQPPSAHLLAAPLTKVLNSLFRTGTVPDFVNGGLVTPVFKKGDPFDTSNYRPITVTEPLMRL